MANDYFPMAGPSEPAAGPTREPEAPAAQEEEQGPTALVPKSVLAGREVKPGDEVTLKVIRIHDDEIEVGSPGGEETPAPPPTAEQEIDQMAQAGPGPGMKGV